MEQDISSIQQGQSSHLKRCMYEVYNEGDPLYLEMDVSVVGLGAG